MTSSCICDISSSVSISVFLSPLRPPISFGGNATGFEHYKTNWCFFTEHLFGNFYSTEKNSKSQTIKNAYSFPHFSLCLALTGY